MTFSKLGLKEEISKALDENTYKNPTVIQEKVIPLF
jgi:ATP-dependent RNA helicase RhlE